MNSVLHEEMWTQYSDHPHRAPLECHDIIYLCGGRIFHITFIDNMNDMRTEYHIYNWSGEVWETIYGPASRMWPERETRVDHEVIKKEMTSPAIRLLDGD